MPVKLGSTWSMSDGVDALRQFDDGIIQAMDQRGTESKGSSSLPKLQGISERLIEFDHHSNSESDLP